MPKQITKKKTSKKKISIRHKISLKLLIPVIALTTALGIFVIYKSSAATCVSVNFSLGSSGGCVKDIQALTNFTLSRSKGSLIVDGSYGATTRDWVKLLQAQNKLPADGVVGAKTWKILCGYYVDFEGWPVKEGQEFYLYAKHAGCKNW